MGWEKVSCGTRESPIVGESGPDPWTGKKSQRLLGSDSTVLQACVLGLSMQGWISIQNRPPLTMKWDCLIPLLHRVRSWIMMISIWLDEIILYLVCIDKCKSRMVNTTRIWKIKLEIKDLLFIAFQQINSRALTNLACLVKGMLYTLKTGQSCWVLVYSVLLLTLFSGNSWYTWWDWRHVRASSWCHISSLVIASFLLKNLSTSNFWGILFKYSNLVYNNFCY